MANITKAKVSIKRYDSLGCWRNSVEPYSFDSEIKATDKFRELVRIAVEKSQPISITVSYYGKTIASFLIK